MHKVICTFTQEFVEDYFQKWPVLRAALFRLIAKSKCIIDFNGDYKLIKSD